MNKKCSHLLSEEKLQHSQKKNRNETGKSIKMLISPFQILKMSKALKH